MAAAPTNDQQALTKKLTNRNVFIASSFLVIVGLVGIFASAALLTNYAAIQLVVSSLSSAALTTGGLAFVWDLSSRRAFASEIIERVQLSHAVVNSGLTNLGRDWQKIIHWDEAIRNARSIDIVVAYSERWYQRSETAFREALNSKGTTLRVFIADPENEDTLNQLRDRFPDRSTARIRQKIQETVAFLEREADTKAGSLQIHYYSSPLDYALYRFDNIAVVTLYTRQGRHVSVPAFAFDTSGSLGGFFTSEIEHLGHSITTRDAEIGNG